ncbi:hypothetical protein VNO77_25470 [Canavalia gladiata]|uniref:Photosystem I reaction center subunit III n=1 Tax=Canavalia gladiata TaxID=3824 RepID=A0AAN9QAY2_CANGL
MGEPIGRIHVSLHTPLTLSTILKPLLSYPPPIPPFQNLKTFSSLLFSSLHHTPTQSSSSSHQVAQPNMSLTIPTNLSKPTSLRPKLSPKLRPTTTTIVCCSGTTNNNTTNVSLDLKAFSAALALSSILLSAPLPAVAEIAGLTPCKESKQFAKREKQSIKKLESSLKLYAPDSAPALAIKATVEKTKRSLSHPDSCSSTSRVGSGGWVGAT